MPKLLAISHEVISLAKCEVSGNCQGCYFDTIVGCVRRSHTDKGCNEYTSESVNGFGYEDNVYIFKKLKQRGVKYE